MATVIKKRGRSVAGTVADPTIEFSELDVDGTKYKLAYSFNAIAEAESIASCNLLQGIAAVMMNTMSALQLRGLLYAALRIAHPGMSIDDAGALVRIDTMPDVQGALLRAYDVSLPERSKILKRPGRAGSKKKPAG